MSLKPQLETFQTYLNQGDFSDAYLEESDSLALRWEDGHVESVTAAQDSGIGFRFLNNLETRFGHTDLTRPLTQPLSSKEKGHLERIHKQLSHGLPQLKPLSVKLPSQQNHPYLKDPRKFSLEQKKELLEKAFKAIPKNPLIRQVNINYGEKIKNIGYVNSDGDAFFEQRVYLVFSMTVTAERDGDIQNAYEALGGVTGFELFDNNQVENLAQMLVERAINKLDAPQAPVGEMPVVIAASAGGTLIHEAVGHSLEADAVLEGTSPAFAGKVGQKVANEKLTVFDDPKVPNKRGSFHFDDEGVASESSKLIDNGVLKDYLFDRISARRAGRKSNGHGRRESYAYRPIPRMSNTLIAPGPDDPQKILDSFKSGLLVTKMGGGQVNTANSDFVFDVEEGFHIKDGKKTMVRGATLLGNGPQVLLNTDQVGSDHGWGLGTCGKEGQGVPVGDAIPTIHIKKLVVGGQ